MIGAGVGGFVLADALAELFGSGPALALWSGVVALLVLLNGALVRLALDPIRSIEDAARRIDAGDESARIPLSPMADRESERIRILFNGMLDRLELTHRNHLEMADLLQEAEEEERRRIADRLFSDPAQLLSASLLDLRRTRHLLGRDSPPDPEELDMARTGIDGARTQVLGALEAIQGIARGLRPPELDELGPTAALRGLARNLEAQAAFRIRVEGDDVDGWLDERGSVALFRIVRDGLRSVARESIFEPLTVHLAGSSKGVRAELRGGGTLRSEDGTAVSRMLSQARLAGGEVEFGCGGATPGPLLILTLPARPDLTRSRPAPPLP